MSGGQLGNLGNYKSISTMYGLPSTRRTADEWGSVLDRPEWFTRAACKGIPTERFLPPSINTTGERLQRKRREWIANANQLIHDHCCICPVIDECDAYGQRLNEVGVYGGQIRLRRNGQGTA